MVVGVTGGVGSGKTEFVRALVRRGATAIDADRLAHHLVETRAGIRCALRRAFGPEVFDAHGRVKRRSLGRLVFADPRKRLELNAILWPPLLAAIRKRICALRRADHGCMVVLDMAVLVESGADALVDRVVFVRAPKDRRLAWLAESRGWSRDESQERMAAQRGDRAQRRRADVVVQNDGTRKDLRQKAAIFFKYGNAVTRAKPLAFRKILL